VCRSRWSLPAPSLPAPTGSLGECRGGLWVRRHRVWSELSDIGNLWAAWQDFARGKRRRPTVATFALEADAHIHALDRQLTARSWRPGGYRLLRIHDPKRRLVAAAPVRDRVVHHAVHRVLAPRLNRRFIDHSYACLPDRGSHRAVLRFRDGLRRHRHVIQLDIRRYFYRIDRSILRDLLFRQLPEPQTRWLIGAILDSGAALYSQPAVTEWLGWDAPGEAGRGIPIGNLTSQWWGNLYLDGLDHFAQRTLPIPMYQRYMDDFTLFGDDRAALLEARAAIIDWLDVNRRLTLKDPHAQPRRADKTHAYLGYRISRRGISPGKRLQDRMPAHLNAHRDDPERFHAAIQALSAAWMFG
jgi:RNA-directed DNA polymerase